MILFLDCDENCYPFVNLRGHPAKYLEAPIHFAGGSGKLTSVVNLSLYDNEYNSLSENV
jgi:hypothetical protein